MFLVGLSFGFQGCTFPPVCARDILAADAQISLKSQTGDPLENESAHVPVSPRAGTPNPDARPARDPLPVPESWGAEGFRV